MACWITWALAIRGYRNPAWALTWEWALARENTVCTLDIETIFEEFYLSVLFLSFRDVINNSILHPEIAEW